MGVGEHVASLPGQIFVGRQQELAHLRAALDEALSGRGQVLVLAGEPGIGKARTAQEVVTPLDVRPNGLDPGPVDAIGPLQGYLESCIIILPVVPGKLSFSHI